MNASVLTQRYKTADPASFSLQPDQAEEIQPKMAPMDHPTAYLVGTQETGAQYFPNMPRTVVPPNAPPTAPAQAAPPSPAQTMAEPKQAKKPLPPGWTEQRMKEADELNQMGRMYRERIDGRRAKRKEITQYDRTKHQLEGAASSIQDLRELKKSYGKDDPHSLQIQQKIMTNLIKAERLHKELQSKAQSLNKIHKIPLGKDGFLEDYDAHLEEDDKGYDEEAMETLSEAYGRRPSD